MKITNFKEEKGKGKARVSATVMWEECDRPVHEVFFETDEAFAGDLSCNPHAFLVGCIIPAMHYGEERIFIDAEICPALRDGLLAAMGWLRQWFFEPDRALVRIEAKMRSGLPFPRTAERAGLFFSGGIDSFAALRDNRMHFTREHPWSIRDGLLVYGLEQDVPEIFEYVRESLLGAAKETGITLIPVYTNLYLNYREEDKINMFSFWYHEFMGAALAAVAHAFASRLTVVSIASDYDIPNQRPHGSHPLTDPNYSSADLRIRHEGITLSRFEKTKLVADWDPALRHLRVCNRYKQYKPGRLNCGRCEKCIRTMLALEAMGKLGSSRVFSENDVSPELLQEALTLKPSTAPLYNQLLFPLAAKGRHDLVHALERKLQEFERQHRMDNWKARVIQADSKYCNGALNKFRRSITT